MNKYRLVFEKKGRAKYISHLDLMRTFQRAFKRAGVGIKHTEGFNPHAHISIAIPLSVGMESVCEILDFEAIEPLGKSAVTEINAVMPEGIIVLELKENNRKVSEIAWIRCEIRLIYDSGVPAGAAEAITSLLASDSVVIRKKTKRGETEFNIVPCINAVSLVQTGNNELEMDVIVSAQNPSLNPMLIINAVAKYLPEMSPDFAVCKRLELYDAELKLF